MTKPRPSFGSFHRARRAKFFWSARHDAFIRMGETSATGRVVVEACSHDAIPAWSMYDPPWLGHQPDEVLDACRPLLELAAAGGLGDGRRLTWMIDEDGLEVVR